MAYRKRLASRWGSVSAPGAGLSLGGVTREVGGRQQERALQKSSCLVYVIICRGRFEIAELHASMPRRAFFCCSRGSL